MFEHLTTKRRTVLKALITAAATAFVAPFAYAIKQYLGYDGSQSGARIPGAPLPVSVAQAPSAKVQISELKASQEKLEIDGEPVILVQEKDNTIRAFTSTCPHRGCIVKYRPQQDDFFCKCHNGLFDRNGINVPGTKPKKPLTELLVRQQGGEVTILLTPKAASTAGTPSRTS